MLCNLCVDNYDDEERLYIYNGGSRWDSGFAVLCRKFLGEQCVFEDGFCVPIHVIDSWWSIFFCFCFSKGVELVLMGVFLLGREFEEKWRWIFVRKTLPIIIIKEFIGVT